MVTVIVVDGGVRRSSGHKGTDVTQSEGSREHALASAAAPAALSSGGQATADAAPDVRRELALTWDMAEPGPPYVLVVGVPLSGAADAAAVVDVLVARLAPVARELRPHASGVAVVLPAGRRPVVGGTARLAAAADEAEALVLLHPPAGDVDALSRQFSRTTAHAAELVRVFGPGPGVVPPERVAAMTALHTAPLRARVDYVRATLGPVLAGPSRTAAPLLELLATMVEGVERGALAAALGLHPKSVAYRRQRLRELTGLDVHRAPQRARLLVAFDLWRANEPAMPAMSTRAWRGRRGRVQPDAGNGTRTP